jgi:hypothetical protein
MVMQREIGGRFPPDRRTGTSDPSYRRWQRERCPRRSTRERSVRLAITLLLSRCQLRLEKAIVTGARARAASKFPFGALDNDGLVRHREIVDAGFQRIAVPFVMTWRSGNSAGWPIVRHLFRGEGSHPWPQSVRLIWRIPRSVSDRPEIKSGRGVAEPVEPCAQASTVAF